MPGRRLRRAVSPPTCYLVVADELVRRARRNLLEGVSKKSIELWRGDVPSMLDERGYAEGESDDEGGVELVE